ncbi:hypothetical protein F5Y12DRAFT_774763 [Xylaria sp. FL1777]|nr:hypothetical protein F5Y12DRAFT_774763 [Xylaria sp. FL1777]
MSPTLTLEQIDYLKSHASETRIPLIHTLNAIFLFATTLSVILRFLSRRIGRSGLGKDDYCLLVAYVSTVLLYLYILRRRKLNPLYSLGILRGLRIVAEYHDSVWDGSPCQLVYIDCLGRCELLCFRHGMRQIFK